MSLHEYLVQVQQFKHNHPEWRLGQTYFNVLHLARPELSEPIRGTELDPFYTDERIPAFLGHLCGIWIGN